MEIVETRDTQVELGDTARSERPSFAVTRAGREAQDSSPAARTRTRRGRPVPRRRAPIIERGSGCRVWDVDGNEYIEYGMGLRAVTLGHGYPPVVDAVAAQLALGTNFVRPSLLELEAAESFLELVARRRHGEVHEGRVDGQHRCGEARSGIHGPRPRRALRRPPLLLVRRLGDGGDPSAGGIPAERRGPDA